MVRRAVFKLNRLVCKLLARALTYSQSSCTKSCAAYGKSLTQKSQTLRDRLGHLRDAEQASLQHLKRAKDKAIAEILAKYEVDYDSAQSRGFAQRSEVSAVLRKINTELETIQEA